MQGGFLSCRAPLLDRHRGVNEQDRLIAAATAAVRKAAERLGVDALMLAEWLEEKHRLADLLELSMRKRPSASHEADAERTLRDYLEFLEREMERQRRTRGRPPG